MELLRPTLNKIISCQCLFILFEGANNGQSPHNN